MRTRNHAEKRLLVSCANLHAGGGVAVATSFLDTLSRLPEAPQVTVLSSSEVDENLRGMSTPIKNFHKYVKFDQRGIAALWQRKPVRYRDFDIVFTIFGPQYALPLGSVSVMGMAQPWVVYPRNEAYRLIPSLRTRVVTHLKYEIQALFFARAKKLIVEQEHVKVGLRKRCLFRKVPIEIVSSAVDSVYFDESRWEPVSLPESNSAIKLGVIARNFTHKNLRILPSVRDILMADHNLDVDIFVTLPDNEWAACPEKFTTTMKNAGRLRLAQCPSFYTQMDGVVFPSLLECYSATPIEALAARKPLFASDLPFIRDTVGENAYHFDPLDAHDIAATVAGYFGSTVLEKAQASDLGRRHVTESATADERARAYLDACGLIGGHLKTNTRVNLTEDLEKPE